MKREIICEIMENISDEYIEEAAFYTARKREIRYGRMAKFAAMACRRVLLAGGIGLAGRVELDSEKPGTVYYSSLGVTGDVYGREEMPFPGSETMDIKAFQESDLARNNCCMIIEGTVTDIYVKHYTYDIYSDKFEENGVLHGRTDTVVYKVAVDKTWYGRDMSGKTVVIEDTLYFADPVLAVKKGGKYVLPVYEYGENIWTLGHEYAGGDITRESRLSTVYPYHPQTQVTEDGAYIVCRDWSTLTQGGRLIDMDTLEEDSYWKDKMYLVDGETFRQQMKVLTEGL